MSETQPKYSVIVPVYNRVGEVRDLTESLLQQSCKDFELIVVEDGSTDRCEAVVEEARRRGLNARYYYKANEGRSIARNYGMARSRGSVLVFFDSDCVVPPQYFETLERELQAQPLDCYGGPDAAHESFSDTQKAINYTMTSFLTTGGIRGGKVRLEKFTPRTFNMGFTREVYERVGGFREMFSEDIDMSTRIRLAGFSIGLIRPAYVWHKRRIDLKKFFRQVYVFGMSRITLQLLYPGSLKAVHLLPAVAVIGLLACVLLGIFVSPWWLLPPALYFLAIFVGALVSTGSLKIALIAIPAAAIQLGGYGLGFIKAWFTKILLRRGRDEQEEINIRKGKNERLS
ncbi:MAG: glycosyltransferase [Muribaculaceae bacterium]|nr:glycosyltransferase [Muribaculaceae bacterium]